QAWPRRRDRDRAARRLRAGLRPRTGKPLSAQPPLDLLETAGARRRLLPGDDLGDRSHRRPHQPPVLIPLAGSPAEPRRLGRGSLSGGRAGARGRAAVAGRDAAPRTGLAGRRRPPPPAARRARTESRRVAPADLRTQLRMADEPAQQEPSAHLRPVRERRRPAHHAAARTLPAVAQSLDADAGEPVSRAGTAFRAVLLAA